MRTDPSQPLIAREAIATREAPWHAGLRGARANLLPGLVLQACALVLVIGYYQHAPTREVLTQLTLLRTKTGFLFSVISTGLCGGVLPFIYLRSRAATRHQFNLLQGLALTVFWGYKGIEVDVWYSVLARYVGEGNDVATILIKMLLDEFVYCPLFAVPVSVLVYAWVEARFASRGIIADVRAGGWYARRVLPVLISNLGVWVPAVCLIYALPTPLQLPLQNLVLVFFTLLLAHLTQQARPAPACGSVTH